MKTTSVPFWRRTSGVGFTLIEILASIAIVMILALLVFTVSGRMMNGAKSATSMNQLRQIATGVTGYTGEHSGRYPPSWYQEKNLSHVEFLNPYIADSDYIVQESPYGMGVYLPPTLRADSVFISPFRKDITEFKKWGHPHSYGPNVNLMPELPRNAEHRQVHVSQVTRPGEIILYADMWTSSPKGGGSASIKSQPGMRGAANLNDVVEVVDRKVGALQFHDGRLHALMADGGARVFKEGEVRKRNLVFGPDESI